MTSRELKPGLYRELLLDIRRKESFTVVSEATNNEVTMYDIPIEEEADRHYSHQELENYTYKLVDESITTVELAKEHYPELFI